ncbi:DUF2271 domain-containing protein [Flammeovirgaceae bacterium SG7u.111]|nr:DUF2271 domain-containing protein [Flammeovirgaceae bacterium SG7u.132]WPO37198.1 DUF2271 domain-containing protein [Flammeovirgaceae bacterium SG7u.111]
MKVIKLGLIFCLVPIIGSWAIKPATDSNSYKCLLQLTNYTGEGAYIVTSLINPEGEYEKTLYVFGKDEKWYHDLAEWWIFFEKSSIQIDGISGASLTGGERAVFVFEIDKEKLNTGYKLRIETAVESQEYYVDDVEFPLTSENVSKKYEGKGYIRYVRIMPN